MENTICLRTAALALIAASVLGSAKADSITWTGEGDTPAWSDGSNWEDGVAPGLGDTVIIPSNAVMIGNNTDFSYANAAATKWAAIEFADATSVLAASNMTAGVTHTVPLVGPGEFRAVQSSEKTFTMNADNSDFTGSFFIKNAPFTAGALGKKTLGLCHNKVTYYGNGAAKNYFQWSSTEAFSNEVHLCSNGGGYLFYGANNKRQDGKIYVHGFSRIWSSGSTAFTFNNDITYDGPTADGISASTGVKFVGWGTLDLGDGYVTSAGKYGTYPGLSIGRRVKGSDLSRVTDSGGWIVFQSRANCLDPNVRLSLNNATAKITMKGGFDQRCGNLTESSATASAMITSESAAIFTVCGSGPASMKSQLNGALSFCLNSTNAAEAGSIGIATGGTMNGSLIAQRGTINVLSAATLSNVTALVASGEGIINAQLTATLDGLRSITVSDSGQVNFSAACLNENLTALEVSDSGSVTLGGGSYRLYSLKVGGRYLPVGNYEVGDPALGDAVKGTGSISVFTKPVAPAGDYVWSGETSADMMVGTNWDGGDLPDYEEGNATAVFDDTGTALAEMTAAGALNGIRFERGTSFTLGGTAPVGLGAGGLSAENTAASGTVTNKLETTLHIGFLPQKQWSLGARTILDVRAPMTSITLDGAEPVGIGGSGTVWLNASSPDLTAPLTFTNSMTRILAPLALGSTNREVRLKAGMIKFAGAGLTNDVPIRFIGNIDSNYATTYQTDGYYRVGDRWIQRGKITAAASTSMACGDGYRFQGGFETDGGSWSLYLPANCHLYIEDNPIRCSGGIYLDNTGHYHFCTTNNVHGTVQINVGTLHLDRDYALCESGTLQLGVSWNDNFDGNLNLEGHVNKIGQVKCGWTPSSKPTRAGMVLGASGTLEVVGSTGSNLAINFQGGTSYKHSGTSTNVFWNAVSTSTGRLEVVNGKVTFRNGAGWSAVKNVTISGTGVIGVQATSADVAFGPEAGRSRATLEFPDDTGTLEIESGTVTVRKLMIGGLYWGPGTYGASDLPSRISGGGSLRVLSGGGSILVVR